MEKTNQVKINKEMIVNALFYTALFIDIFIVILEKSDYIIQFEGKYFQLTFLLFGLKVLLTKYSNKEWGVIFAFGLLGILSYFATGRNEILRLVMMIAASKNISLKKVMRCVFYMTLAGVAVIILLSVTGIYGTVFVEADFRMNGIERRYVLGMGHPNALHCMIWSLTVLALYLFLDKMKWYYFVILFVINHGFYLLTDSRTGMLINFATILLAVLIHYVKGIRETKWIYFLGILGVLGGILFSVITASFGISIKILEKINGFVTGRIQWAYVHNPMSSWTLFSTPAHEAYQDMGFVRMFDWYGYLPGIIYTIVVCLMVWDCYKRKKYKEFIVIMAFTAYTVFEAHAVSVYLTRNYLLLLLIGTWSEIFHAGGTLERHIWQFLPLKKKEHQGSR